MKGVSFLSSTTYSVGVGAAAIAHGDVNGDGKVDIAIGGDNNIQVYVNAGNGVFLPPVMYAAGQLVSSIAFGDMNGDGKDDLATTNTISTGGTTISVLLNKGDGTFAPLVSYAAGTGTKLLAVGDVDGDGKADIAVANEDSSGMGTLLILLNNGNATFAAPASYPFGAAGWGGIALADLNGDKRLDVVLSNGGSGVKNSYAGVFLNNGNGTFHAIVNYPVSDGVDMVALGDVNGDGAIDIAVETSSSGRAIDVLINKGNGTFATSVRHLLGTNYAEGFSLGDLNGDKMADIAFTNSQPDYISVLLAGSNGTLASPVSYVAGPSNRLVLLTDVTGDGKADLIAAPSNRSGVLSVLINRGDGTLIASPTFIDPAAIETVAVAMGDINGDGKPDVALANHGSNSISVFLDNGKGGLGAAVSYVVGVNPSAVALTDVTGDGRVDLIAANSTSNTISVLTNNGTGVFSAPASYATGMKPVAIASGDFNGDGKTDLAIANFGSGNISVLLNKGNVGFAAAVSYGAGANPNSIAAADLDGDGKVDLAVANNCCNVSVLLNSGNGTFASAVNYSDGAGPVGVALGDVNADGLVDMVVANGSSSGSVSVFLNKGKGVFAPAVDFPANPNEISVALGDLDGDGRPDVIVTSYNPNLPSAVSVLLNKGAGVFGPSVDFFAGTNPAGVAIGDLNGDGQNDLAVAVESGCTLLLNTTH